MSSKLPEGAQSAVFQISEFDTTGQTAVKGFNYDHPFTVDRFAQSMLTTGFQATNFGLAINEVNRMLNWTPADIEAPLVPTNNPPPPPDAKCTIFLAYTSNLMSSGLRETFLFLVKNKLVDVIVSSAGGVEEDFIKCLGDTYLGEFKMKGSELRANGVNRAGNLLIPNGNYCKFEDWISPILHTMTDEQVNDGVRWSPSNIIHRLGKEINNEESVYYWAYRNNIPVFCPALTDGSIGDMMYFHNYKRPEFVCDVVQDIRKINDIAVRAHCTGQLILGGGVVKHHTCNANLMRNGADFSVYINTGQEFDGSDAGASPDEAVSWGKIKLNAKPIKVSCDATLVFPLLVSQTFLKYHEKKQAEKNA